MQCELTEEQTELVALIRSVLTQRSSSAAVRTAMASEHGYDPELWRVLCEEIGAASLAIPEEYDGAGYTSFETHLVLEELGAALTPSPFLASVAIAAQALLAAGDDDANSRLLPGIAAGSTIATLAWADAGGRWSPHTTAVLAIQRGEGWTLNGESPLVIDGGHADTVLVIARTATGAGLFEVTDPETITRLVTPGVDPTLRFAKLTFADTPVRPLSVNDDAVLEQVRDVALTAISALQLGTASRGLASTVEYSKQRVQFGRAIGSFQALKHRMAEMHVQLETARTASRSAAAVMAGDLPGRTLSAALAKAWCSDALELIASETVQIHGGIAITWEHDAQLIFKRAHATAQLFGTAAEQRSRIGKLMGLDAS